MNIDTPMSFTITPNQDKQRIDHVLARKYPDVSRGFLQSLCKDQKVLVNNSPQKSGYKVRWGDNVLVLYDPENIGVTPDIDLPIIYDDDDVLVINKPSGVLSHALSKFKQEPSVASFLRQHIQTQGSDYDIRFGIVHRLDRATSGVMLCAKNSKTMKMLQEQFAKRTVQKTYVAVVSGVLNPERAVIDIPIERNPKAPATFRPGSRGKASQTEYEVLNMNQNKSLVKLSPKTGRTHQLRVHMTHVGCPIIGDVLYDGETADRLYLHAHQLRLSIPSQADKIFTAPIPQSFDDILNGLS